MPYAHLVDGSASIDLKAVNTRDDFGLEKKQGEEEADRLGKELGELEDLLYYANQNSLLIVLQGMDTSGKDGLIRFLLNSMNALGTDVVPFKVPTEEELSHDFLWRVHSKAPRLGHVAVFNRSHYEDVLVVRVHSLVAEPIWRQRYEHIRAFERLLLESNTIVIKLFLHISKEEQETRLLQREAAIEKAWKLSVGDWKERAHWDEYQAAYQEAIDRTATEEAPWHVVPADHKWARNLAAAEAIVNALRPYRHAWLESLRAYGERAKADLVAYRAAAEKG
ncbi:MAG: hypothetical protein KIT11_01620 [Fimbriimonadaceae bacterium]|nr:hypothetical protein [Fimbriimonadaceae bacterium]QYK54931.1 MAG: hypothetical protein KF733_07915 [Fimbriimonadaceae bacterium]